MDPSPLRLMVYDRTCTGPPLLPGLTHTWIAGAWLYRALGRLDDWKGAAGWEEALRWLLERAGEQRVAEVQVWCHGQWGNARMNGDLLDERSLRPGHPHHGLLTGLAGKMLGGSDGLFWFRTCQTYGAVAGRLFAARFTSLLGCRTAGHTFIIGPWHSGLHSLLPGQAPYWSPAEGLKRGGPEAPIKAQWSGPRRPNTITCLHGKVPRSF